MEENKVTVGETTAEVKTAAPLSVVIATIVNLLIMVGKSFKRVGGEFVSESEMKRFINTLYTLSNIGPYDTTLIVEGVPFPVEAFKVDTRIQDAFLQPRAVVMPGTSPFRKDVSVHSKSGNIMTPAELIEFQFKFLAMFKAQPTLQSPIEGLKPRNLSECVECGNGRAYHVEDLASIKSIPTELKLAEELFGEHYFSYAQQDVIRMVVTNFYSNLK